MRASLTEEAGYFARPRRRGGSRISAALPLQDSLAAASALPRPKAIIVGSAHFTPHNPASVALCNQMDDFDVLT